ncbi:hypothetical protein [Bacillus amyloliquefaciens]|uniref:hypothetical protein n=1 Tax=Bacillus amyloliquefaciens TaxID=1390 RepID=UPI0028093F4B|nr:hypothetical protein [Bacillus amyloliquefaciens]MDQ8094259.1 hypothetical protein [Bacillus amyloliquefaciens]
MRDESVRYYNAVANGYMTVNEVRNLHGLNPIDKGDDLYNRLEYGSYEIVGSSYRGITEERLRRLIDEATVIGSGTNRETSPNLLTDEQSIPRIVYKGEEITGRIAIDFEWRTKDADQCGSTYYRIKHTKDIAGAPVVETKELAVGARAYGA